MFPLNKNLILLIVLVTLWLPTSTSAAGVDFDISILPQNYAPESRITAIIKSFQFDTDRATITWFVDGATTKGMGEKRVSFQAPAFGKSKKISASITTAEGGSLSKSITLVGNDVDLLMESVSSAPPWYRGKMLPSSRSSVKITAIPYLFSDGRILNSSDLIYEWFLNFKKDINASGASRDFFTFRFDNRDDDVVNVKVSNRSGSIFWEKSITMISGLTKPEVLIYENHPLEGPLFHRAITNFTIFSQEEKQFIAVPYNFSMSSSDDLSYKWSVNGEEETEILPQDYLFNFRSVADAIGNVAVSLSVSNSQNIFQQASTLFNISVE